MKTLNNKQFKAEYRKNHPGMTGSKVKSFKQILTYPNDGAIRFQIKLDKNGQVYDIHQSFAQIIRDSETKKRFVKVTLGDRPQHLFERIKGRPFELTTDRIDSYIEDSLVESENEQ